jgi:hypothetical protein
MCWMRTRSSPPILDLGGANHFISEIAAEIVWGSQVNSSPTEYVGKLSYHISQGPLARLLPVVELHQKVNVALRVGNQTANGDECGASDGTLLQLLCYSREP